jgi:hypothetical protein
VDTGLERIKAVGAAVATAVTAGILIWWLILAANRIGMAPTLDKEGKVVVDEWGRVKDILLVVLPLFSAALAYWVGSQGTTDAKKEADAAKQKLDAVIDSSPEGVLKRAKAAHPEAFH